MENNTRVAIENATQTLGFSLTIILCFVALTQFLTNCSNQNTKEHLDSYQTQKFLEAKKIERDAAVKTECLKHNTADECRKLFVTVTEKYNE